MAVLCLGALLAGFAAAMALPFLPFACAVLAAILIGTASMIATGGSVLQTGVSALAILFVCQIGYALGLVAAALAGHAVAVSRRPAADKPGTHPAQPLRTGNEPR